MGVWKGPIAQHIVNGGLTRAIVDICTLSPLLYKPKVFEDQTIVLKLRVRLFLTYIYRKNVGKLGFLLLRIAISVGRVFVYP